MAITPTTYNGVKGVYSIGRLKFKKNKQPLFNWAIESFNIYSKYGKDQNPSLDEETLNSYLTYFLFALEITSSHEGGFDAVNTYDRAGISVGFIQFARPNVGVYKLLTEIDTVLRDEVKESFGDYPVNQIQRDYNDADSVKARQDRDLIERVQNAIVTEQGIKAQIRFAIEDFYDPAFEEFLKFESNFISTNNVNVPENDVLSDSSQLILLNQEQENNEKRDNFIYANALFFDVAVNKGLSRLKDIKELPFIYNNTEGNFLFYNIENVRFARERKQKWNELFEKNFTESQIYDS